MAKQVYMPTLGMNQNTGTLLRWLKAEGEAVVQGEPLMEVATDKADVTIEAPASGVLAEVTAAPGDEVPVGQTIARILTPGERAAPQPALAVHPPAIQASPVAARMAAEHNVDLARVKPSGGRVQKQDVIAYLSAQPGLVAAAASARLPASPKARRLAAEHGVALVELAGSGPGGAVLAADVLSAIAARPAGETALVGEPPPSPELIPVSRMWQVMGQRLAESWASVPHFYLTREVDACRLVAWRAQINARHDVKVTYTDLVVKLTAVALRRHPRLNAAWVDGVIVANDEVNIGLAIAVEDGLLVPVIHGVDRLGLQALALRRSELVDRTRAGGLSLADLDGGTFTLSNLGMYGVDQFSAIVNPPQAAILAVGRIVDKVIPVDGQPAVRPTLAFTLSCDHRVVDGARAAAFLTTLADLAQEPLAALD